MGRPTAALSVMPSMADPEANALYILASSKMNHF